MRKKKKGFKNASKIAREEMPIYTRIYIAQKMKESTRSCSQTKRWPYTVYRPGRKLSWHPINMKTNDLIMDGILSSAAASALIQQTSGAFWRLTWINKMDGCSQNKTDKTKAENFFCLFFAFFHFILWPILCFLGPLAQDKSTQTTWRQRRKTDSDRLAVCQGSYHIIWNAAAINRQHSEGM